MKINIIFSVVSLLALTLGCKPSSLSTPSSTVDVAAFTPLMGRWVRPDGGYILMIHHVEPDGKVAAGYFNPNQIRISQAQATIEGVTLKLFVELNDEGYPGCTYRLTYDKAADQLTGVYFQAAMRQSYNIMFARAP